MIDQVRARLLQQTPAHDLADPLTLMQQAGLDADPWQRAALTSTARKLCLLCARQVGKSSCAAAIALSVALAQPGSLAVCVAPSERQSKEWLRKAVALYRALGRPVPADVEGKIELELTNGSRILALPANESTTRGLSNIALLVCDEGAYLPEPIYLGMLPALAADGRTVVLSTPWAKGSWLHREWTEGDNWERIRVTVYDSPRYTPERIAEVRRSMPDLWWRSQFLCEWVESEDQVFAYDLIQSCVSADVQPLFPTVRAREDVWVIS